MRLDQGFFFSVKSVRATAKEVEGLSFWRAGAIRDIRTEILKRDQPIFFNPFDPGHPVIIQVSAQISLRCSWEGTLQKLSSSDHKDRLLRYVRVYVVDL